MDKEPFHIPAFIHAEIQRCTRSELESVQDEIARALSRGVDEDEIKKRAVDSGWEPKLTDWLIRVVKDHGPQDLKFTTPSMAKTSAGGSVASSDDLRKIEGHLAEIKGWARFFGVLTTLGIVAYIVLDIYIVGARQGR